MSENVYHNFYPVFSFVRIGSVSVAKVLGIAVYKRIGFRRSVFGFAWGRDNAA